MSTLREVRSHPGDTENTIWRWECEACQWATDSPQDQAHSTPRCLGVGGWRQYVAVDALLEHGALEAVGGVLDEIAGDAADGKLHRRDVLDDAEQTVRAAIDAAKDGAACDHDWRSARNAFVESGEICVKCHALRAEPNS